MTSIYFLDPAVISVDRSVRIAPYAVIGLMPDATAANRRRIEVPFRDVKIAMNSVVGAHSTIYFGVSIGRDCRIGDGAIMREGSFCGRECVIGVNVDVQYNVKIGHRVRILNGTHVTGGTEIGDDTFIGPGVMMANDNGIDPMNYTDRPEERKAPIIGKGVFIGVGAIILPGVVIGDRAKIGAGAVVTKNVDPGDTVVGVPARSIGIPRLEGDR